MKSPPSFPKQLPKPASLRLTSTQGDPLQLAVASESTDWKAEAVSPRWQSDRRHGAGHASSRWGSCESHYHYQGWEDCRSQSRDATLQASYGDVRTTEGLKVHVTQDAEIDEIRIVPGEVTLVVGDSAMLQAEGYKAGKRIGSISNRDDLIWKMDSGDQIEGGDVVFQAAQPGSNTVVAQLGSVSSQPCKITVLDKTSSGQTPPAAGKLTVQPGRIKLKVGERVAVGSDVRVQRGSADFSSDCDVSPAGRIVAYHPDSRTLEAVSVGRTRVTFTHRDQSAVLQVEVVPPIRLRRNRRSSSSRRMGALRSPNCWA